MFDFDPAEKWQIVSAGVDAFGAIVSLGAAVAAWSAAVASKRAVNEMSAARHQYVKPVLVFREPAEIEINLGAWHEGPGAGHPLYEAAIEIKNVGKGPAFGVEFTWNFEGQARARKVPIDVESINRALASSTLEVVDGEREWEVRVKNSRQFYWRIPKFDFFTTKRFDKIEEGEVVTVRIPDEVLGLQILHSLNQLAALTEAEGRMPTYAQPASWEPTECDWVSMTFRSITDELHSLSLRAVPRLGIYGDHDHVPFLAQVRVSLTPNLGGSHT